MISIVGLWQVTPDKSSKPRLNGIVLADCAAVECKDRYIKIFQGKYDGNKVINGEIVNTCPVTITDLHVDCGAFIKSMKYIPVPPYVLRAVNNTDCVVNNGRPIRGHPIFFKYYNSEMLPLTVTSFKCFRH
ncbi:TPD1 protein homolog 1-like [Arachis ipaensis]|uniref:TPD1 protein homolog 1-like n=1 Tax=Arachis ipaensis TaxID=130454 RepID=UPI0007AF36F6|nr:TPD1 protein homolog 1-like [Arachis ipaensis]